jgi:archaemetzincin
MKIGVLRIGSVDSTVIERVQENLKMVFPKTIYTLLDEALPIPKEAYDEKRQQHRSNIILTTIRAQTAKQKTLDRILGVIDTDIFVSPLSYVFGQAECLGKAALISLHRLRQEFYNKKPDTDLFIERATKEAVHELGHTFGLQHCSNPFCVMYFSNSIFDTDRKQSLFCNKCYMKVETKTDKHREKA